MIDSGLHTHCITAHPCSIYGSLSYDDLNSIPQLEIKVPQLCLLISKAADRPHGGEALLWNTVCLGIGLLPLLCQVLREERYTVDWFVYYEYLLTVNCDFSYTVEPLSKGHFGTSDICLQLSLIVKFLLFGG